MKAAVAARCDAVRARSASPSRPVCIRSTIPPSIAKGASTSPTAAPRGQQSPVSIFRVVAGRRRASRSSPASSTPRRWSSGRTGCSTCRAASTASVYRVFEDGRHEVIASDLGLACGLAFAPDGTLLVGDRSGTIFHIDGKGRTETLASLPASVAAFHLAMGPDDALYVTGPTLATLRSASTASTLDGHVRSAGPHLRPAAGSGLRRQRRPARRRSAGRRERHLPPAGWWREGTGRLGRAPGRTGLRRGRPPRGRLERQRLGVQRLNRPSPPCLRNAFPAPCFRALITARESTVRAKAHRRAPAAWRGCACAQARPRCRRSDHAGDRRRHRRRDFRRDRDRGRRPGRAPTARSSATARVRR